MDFAQNFREDRSRQALSEILAGKKSYTYHFQNGGHNVHFPVELRVIFDPLGLDTLERTIFYKI